MIRIVLREEDFRDLVAGRVVRPITTAASILAPEIEIILSDIGWERMIAALTDAMHGEALAVHLSDRAFNPLPADHPLVGETCPACGKQFEPGDITTLVELGPGADQDAQRAAREGSHYSAVAMPVHYACATGARP